MRTKKESCLSNSLFCPNRQRPTFPGSFPPSIISAKELNDCVRDGNRWVLLAMVTGYVSQISSSFFGTSVSWSSFHSKMSSLFNTFKTEQCIFSLAWNHWSSVRPISIGQLHALLHFHLRPIYVVVSHGSYLFRGKSLLVGGFALRCFQRLSRPYVATQRCSWQNNWYTRGMSIPVLSY